MIDVLTRTDNSSNIQLSVAERNLILRLRSLRDKPRLIWLEVTPTTLAIETIQELRREKLGE